MTAWTDYIPPLNLYNWPSFYQGDIMHPLSPSLGELSDDELQKKYGELQKRWAQAYRFGPTSVVPQLQMLIEDYQFEINRRSQKQFEEQMKSQKGPKGIIDIS